MIRGRAMGFVVISLVWSATGSSIAHCGGAAFSYPGYLVAVNYTQREIENGMKLDEIQLRSRFPEAYSGQVEKVEVLNSIYIEWETPSTRTEWSNSCECWRPRVWCLRGRGRNRAGWLGCGWRRR